MDQYLKELGRPPAGGRVEAAAETSPIPAGQQSGGDVSGVIVANERDRRTLSWLRDHVGDAAISGAVSSLSGNRQPYISNVLKVLGVKAPESLERPDAATAKAHIAALRAKLGI